MKLFICASLFLLTACEKTKDFFGLTRDVPDEFAVVGRPPLDLPPDFNLRPPSASHSSKTSLIVQEKMLGKIEQDREKITAVEENLLQKTRAEERSKEIRHELHAEQSPKKERTFMQQLAFWKPRYSKGDPIDPKEEKKKLEDEALRHGKNVRAVRKISSTHKSDHRSNRNMSDKFLNQQKNLNNDYSAD